MGYVSIREDQVCDGIIDCIDGKDESAARCNGRNDMQRFFCSALGGKMVSVKSIEESELIFYIVILRPGVIECRVYSGLINTRDTRQQGRHYVF